MKAIKPIAAFAFLSGALYFATQATAQDLPRPVPVEPPHVVKPAPLHVVVQPQVVVPIPRADSWPIPVEPLPLRIVPPDTDIGPLPKPPHADIAPLPHADIAPLPRLPHADIAPVPQAGIAPLPKLPHADIAPLPHADIAPPPGVDIGPSRGADIGQEKALPQPVDRLGVYISSDNHLRLTGGSPGNFVAIFVGIERTMVPLPGDAWLRIKPLATLVVGEFDVDGEFTQAIAYTGPRVEPVDAYLQALTMEHDSTFFMTSPVVAVEFDGFRKIVMTPLP